MLTVNTIREHLDRLGLDAYSIARTEGDENGDMVKAFLPDLPFSVAKEKILTHKFYKKYLEDFTIDQYNFGIHDIIDGIRVFYRLYISKEDFGTSFAVLVKRIDFYDSFGNYVPLLGFGMLKEYQDKDLENKERFEATGEI